MAKSLVMNFLNTSGKNVSLRVNNVNETLTAENVGAAMDTIIAKNIFLSTGGDFAKKDSAHIVDTEITDLEIA